MSFELTSCFPVKSHFSSKHYGSNESIENDNFEDHGFVPTWETTKKSTLTKNRRLNGGSSPERFHRSIRDEYSSEQGDYANGRTCVKADIHHFERNESEFKSSPSKRGNKSLHYAGSPDRSFHSSNAQTGVLQKLHHIKRSQNAGSRRCQDVGQAQLCNHNDSNSLLEPLNSSLGIYDSTYGTNSQSNNSFSGSEMYTNLKLPHNSSINLSSNPVSPNITALNDQNSSHTSTLPSSISSSSYFNNVTKYNSCIKVPSISNDNRANFSLNSSHAENDERVQERQHHHVHFQINGDGNSSRTESPPVEATEIIELLRMKNAFVSGGRDQRGSLIISIPNCDGNKRLSSNDLSFVLSYLISNIRSTALCSGFTVIIDGRNLESRILVGILQAFEVHYEPQTTFLYVVKLDIFSDINKFLEIRSERIISRIQIQYVSLSKLHKIIDPSQLTEEFSGTLNYSHNQWLQNTMDIEKFKRDTNATLKDLDTSLTQLSNHSKRFSKSNADNLMQELHELYRCTMALPGVTIENGHQLLRQLETDQDSGFRTTPESGQMKDSFMAQDKVKDLLKSVCDEKEKFEEEWHQSEHKLSHLVNIMHMEEGIKLVIDFVLGPAEYILNSQQEIGNSFYTVEELKRQHERLELKCAETYGHYAELKYKAEEISMRLPHEMVVADILIQKEYMDAVCRSFAARLERRRNILICSSRFHRLTEEILHRSADIDNASENDYKIESVSVAKVSLQLLEDERSALFSLRENALQEGNRLLDSLVLPVKNALGKDVTPDYTQQIEHIQSMLDNLESKMTYCNDVVEMRRVRLKQIVQIHTCESDAKQAVQWILDLCEVLVESHNQLGITVSQIEDLEEEHLKFEDTAKGTYDYGRQLLETALILRKSSDLCLTTQNELVQNLFDSWRKFLQGTQERKMRLNVCKNFYVSSEKMINELDMMNKDLKKTLKERSPQTMINLKKYRESRDKLVSEIVEILRSGKTLLHKIHLPVISSDESHKDYSDFVAAEKIQDNITSIESLAEVIDNILIDDEIVSSSSDAPTSSSYKTAEESLSSTRTDDWKTATDDSHQNDSWYSAVEDFKDTDKESLTDTEFEFKPAKGSEVMYESSKSKSETTSIKYSREWGGSGGQTTKLSFERKSDEQPPENFLTNPFQGCTKKSDNDGHHIVIQIESQDEDTYDGSKSGNGIQRSPSDPSICLPQSEDELYECLSLSKEWLELKIQDMQPEMTRVGSSIEEATELFTCHQTALEKLRTKQSPVEELLNQADQMISNQRPRAEVYSAMAETLGNAWKQLNCHLEYRKHILEQSVNFQTKAKQLSDQISEAESTFTDNYLPEDAETCRKLLQALTDAKKVILEISRQTINEGHNLIDKLKHISISAMGDARGHDYHVNTVFCACKAIEKQMEELNDRRRRFLDIMLLKRKKFLEECLQMCLIRQDLKEIEQWIRTEGEHYVQNHSLGNSPANAEILQHEHRKFHSKTLKMQDSLIKLTHTSEKLNKQGHFAGDELQKQTFSTLDQCTKLLDICDNREKLYIMSIDFFRSSQSALSKLDQVEVQLKTVDLTLKSSSLVQLHSQLSLTISSITEQPIADGKSIISLAANEGCNGVIKTVAELENRKLTLDNMCTAHRSENIQRTQLYENFEQRIHDLESWLSEILESFLRSYQDMGSNVMMARNFYESHERKMHDLQVKEVELDNLESLIPNIRESESAESRDIQQRIYLLHSRWSTMRSYLEQRVKIANLYYYFYLNMTEFNKSLEDFETKARNKSFSEEEWMEIMNAYQNLSKKGYNFIDNSKKVDSEYLDIGRAILCVETTLDDIKKRIEAIPDSITIKTSTIESVDTWELFTSQVKVSLSCVEKTERDMFPVIPTDVISSKSIVTVLESKMDGLLPTAEFIKSELKKQSKIADGLTVKENLQSQKDKMIESLRESENKFQAMLTDYQVLVNVLLSFFKNMNEMEKIIEKNENNYGSSFTLQSGTDVEQALQEHVANRQTILELFKFTENEGELAIKRIHQVEPADLSSLDENKIRMILESSKRNWEQSWEQHRRYLQQEVEFSHFKKDLRQINTQISELTKQLERMKGNYGNSVSTAKNTASIFFNFERSIETLGVQIKEFSSTAEKMLENQHYNSSHISMEIEELQTKWSTFYRQVGKNKVLIDLSIEYFEIIEEIEEWLREGSRILITTSRKSTSVRTPEEVDKLVEELENFTKSQEAYQEERMNKLESMSQQLYGESSYIHMQPILSKTKEMKASFVAVNSELLSLMNNLKETEQLISSAQKEKDEALLSLERSKTANIEDEQSIQQISTPILMSENVTRRNFHSNETYMNSYSWTKTENTSKNIFSGQVLDSKPPEFSSLLGDAHVMEGTKVQFECNVTGEPIPQIFWYKDGIMIDNNPDYKTSFTNGLCSLSIEETLPEDSAKFTCRATNMVGIAETQGRLFVQESRPHEELVAPDFVKRLEPATVEVGQSFQFECQVKGYPLPVVTWTKDGVCVDNVPDYVITYNNGQCILRFEEVFKVDEATYSCRAANQIGQAICNANLTVKAEEMSVAPSFSTSLSNVMARAGQKIKLECSVRGRPKPKLTWLHNNKPIKEPTKQMSYEGRKATLLITEAYPKDAGTYLIIAKNKAGEATSSCNVSVKGRLPVETSDSELASDLEPVKPRVVVPLKTVSITEGSKARLDCTIVGQPEPEVIWYHNGKPVKESNDFQLLFEGDQCSLLIKEAYLEDAGMYYCTAINSAGEVSSEGQLIVESPSNTGRSAQSHKENPSKEVAIAPKFLKLLNDTTVVIGKEFTFECSVTGQPEPVCHWYKGEEKIESSGDYQIAKDKNGLLSLYIPQISSNDEGTYTVLASNSAGDAKCYANLTVVTSEKKEAIKPKEKAPGFTQLFSDQVTQKGKTVKFECVVSGNPKPEVQWTFNDLPVKPWDYEISSAGDRYWLTIPVTGSRHRGRYEITAENAEGKATCSAQLDFDDFQDLIPGDFKEESTESSIVTRKTVTQSMVTKTGSSSNIPDKMEVHKLTSAANYSYKKIGDQPPEESKLSEKTEEHEVIPSEMKQDSKVVECGVIRKKTAAPSIKEPLVGVETEEGKEVILFTIIEAEPQPNVRWFKDEKEVLRTPGISTSFNKNRAELVINKVQSKDSGCYKCTAQNIAGNASTSADLQVKVDKVAPSFKQPLDGVIINEGETAVFVAVIAGKPTPTVHWFKNNVKLDEENQNTSISFSRGRAMLRITKTDENDSGCYKCTASNCAGNSSSSANLKVNPTTAMYCQPSFKRPLSSISTDEGKVAVFSANLDAKPEPSVRWFKDGAEIRPDSGKISIENGPTTVKLIIPETSVKDSGRYTCTVSNIAGTATTTGNLLVKGAVMPPQFVKRLAAMVVKSGDKVSMTVEVNGIPNPTVEWFKDDELVQNTPDTRISSIGKKHTLVIPEAFPDDSGRYAVVAKNEGGEAKSAADFIVEEESGKSNDKKEIHSPRK